MARRETARGSRLTGREIVDAYFAMGMRPVFWPENGDAKGPREPGWQEKVWRPEDWSEGMRVGLMLGTAIAPGRFLLDFDIDWAEGASIAARMLPPTHFVFGRAGKRVSHAFYTCPEPIPSIRYVDADKTLLLEMRCAKSDGTVGLQTMVPPSPWTKDGRMEVLTFARWGEPAHIEATASVGEFGALTAIPMTIARRLGKHGFGHEARLAWAGFMLRAGLKSEDLIAMGEAISGLCDNSETRDVRTVIETTQRAMVSGRKTSGGPSFARIMGDLGPATIARIDEWLGRGQDFVRDKNGRPLAESQENVRRACTMVGWRFSRDAFADRSLMEENGREPVAMDDLSVNRLRLLIDREHRFRPSKEFFRDVLEDTAAENEFHPVRDWLDSLEWDGTKRIDTWVIDFAGARDDEYVRTVSRIFLVAAVRRARRPGAKYDEMPVFESDQGMNKSSALRTLCPKDEWFSDDLPLNVDTKQLIERTLGKWIIEASDLAGKRKTEVEQLKSMMSKQVDGPVRLAYGRLPVERPRGFVLAGTTNKRIYLIDPTGARRFWPIAVGTFDLEGLRAARDQLWAEAAAAEAAGESIRLPERLWPVAAAEQEERREADAWEDEIGAIIEATREGKDGRRRLSSREIWGALGIGIERRDRTGGNRISEIMQKFGFRATKIRAPGESGPQSGYVELGQWTRGKPEEGRDVGRIDEP